MLRSVLLASSALLVLAGQAQAQDADTTELAEVVVTGSQVSLPPVHAGGQVARGGRVGLFGALDAMDTPFATTSYTEELARNQQTRSIGDILQNDPAVRVSKGFGNFQELYVIRGLPVYSDDMTYNGLYGVLPRQFVASEFVERVEVFHGATAFLNGAAPGGSGVGGAFNLVPKRAGNQDLTRMTAGWSGVDEIYGAADLSRRFGDDGAYGVRLNLAGRSGEGSVEDSGSELGLIGLGLDRRGDRARFSADLGWQDHHITAPNPPVTPLGAVPTPPSSDTNFAQPWTYTDEEQLFGAARGEFDLTDSVTAWAAFGGRSGKEDNSLANPNSNAAGALSAARFDNIRKDTVWSGDIGLRADLNTGSIGHRLVVSASQVQLKARNAFTYSDTNVAWDLYDPTDVAPPTGFYAGGGDMNNPEVTERVKTSSVAVADMISFLDGRLLATVGVRYQEVETSSYSYVTGAFGSGYSGDATTPAFGLVYKPSDSLSLYANYAEALQPGKTAPSVINGVPVDNAGEVLAPFRSEQVEVGAKYDGGGFGGSLSVFRTLLPSEAFDPVTAIYSDGGEQENQGVELSVFGEPVTGLRIIGGAIWIESEIIRSLTPALVGKSAIGVPEFQSTLNVEWDVPALTGLTLEGRAVYTGSQAVSADNAVELGDWTRFDAGVRYAFVAGDKPLTLRARVENIADENQWVAVGGYPGANYLTLGAPRSFTVSISAEF